MVIGSNDISFRPTIAVIDEKPSENIVINADVTTPRNTTFTGDNNGVQAGPITVTINYGDTELQKQYKEGAEGNWVTVNESVKQLSITSNKTIYARYYDGEKGSKTKSYTIANVDNVEPEYKAYYINKEDNVEISVDDIVEDTIVKYYFSKDDENTWEEVSNIPITTSKNATGIYSVKLIDEAGNSKIIKLTQEEGITTRRISKNPTEYYGKEITNYNCTNSGGVNAWKILYADNSNIYLITDDYIRYDYCPPSATQKIYKNTDYKLSMNNVIKDYSGSSNITDKKIQALNSDYFDKRYGNSFNNMKAVAYMLDTSVWNVFAGEKAEYAIGGPTIEMLMKSYSQKYNVDYRAQAGSHYGYQISRNGGKDWATGYDKLLNVSDNLYVINNGEKAGGMWIASPPLDNNTNSMMYIQTNGSIVVNLYGYTLAFPGFRPVVCLKPYVELEKNEDGTYSIK